MSLPASMPASPSPVVDAPTPDSTVAPLVRRADALAHLVDTTWDVLIVGGGVVGAGALLDATSRGLTAALIEQDDIAAGTSSRSSRLIHGGLRYLEQVHLPLVREALAERRRLLRNAPHLVTLEPQLFPIYGIPFLHKAFYDAGLTLYDILGARHDGGWHRRLDRDGTLGIAPRLRPEGLRGGLLYHDGVEDDARFTLALVRTALAIDAGQVAITRVRATKVDPGGGGPDRPAIAHVRDVLDDLDLAVRADSVVDATGVWAADPDAAFAGPAGRLLPSRGAHLVVPRARIPATAGITIRVPGKVVFLIPWPDFWLIGTTDAPFDGPPDHPAAASWEVDELLATVNATMDVELGRDDVVGTYAGLRPLVADAGGSTVKASREHSVTATPSGVVRIGGGKYTTYRVMARDVIDGALGRAAARRRPSDTADRPLVGAADRPQLEALVQRLGRHPDLAAIHPQAASRLVARHGSEAPGVLALARETGLLRPLVAGRPFLEAEVAWAVRRELALTVDDVLSRRLRLSPELADRGAAVAPRVAAIMAGELGWDEARAAREAETYLASAAVEYGVPAAG